MIDKDNFGNWIAMYKRQTAVGCIVLCLILVAAVVIIGKKKGAAQAEAADALISQEQADETEEEGGALVSAAGSQEGAATQIEPNVLEQDAHEDVNTIVQQYYEYLSSGDMEGLATVVDEISDEEKSRIIGSQTLVESYQNISCYTKKGLEEGSYVVFVYYELKFKSIETAAPGLSPLYVYTNEEGNLCIMNREASDELKEYVEEMADGDDVKALRNEVKEKYEAAKAADENLAKQEERYVRLSSESKEEETEVADAGEETPEETPEEPPAEEAPAEEPPQEEPAPAAEGTAQNRETRFTESVRLRAEPSTDAEYLGTVYQGEQVTQIESYADGWSKIKYNDKECYCKTEFLE